MHTNDGDGFAMDDLEVMDLFAQFAAGLPDPEPPDPAGRIARALQDRERLGEITALRLTEPDVQHILRDVWCEASSALGLPNAVVTIGREDGHQFAGQAGPNRRLNTSEAGGAKRGRDDGGSGE